MKSRKQELVVEDIELGDEDIVKRASSKIILLPTNWPVSTNEPVYAGSTQSLRKLFRREGVEADTYGPITETTHLEDNRALDWVAPTFCDSSLLLTQNQYAVSVALNVISHYVAKILEGTKDDPIVKLSLIYADRGAASKRIRYEGPVSGLSEVAKVVDKLRSKSNHEL